jgi:hypothetical protein
VPRDDDVEVLGGEGAGRAEGFPAQIGNGATGLRPQAARVVEHRHRSAQRAEGARRERSEGGGEVDAAAFGGDMGLQACAELRPQFRLEGKFVAGASRVKKPQARPAPLEQLCHADNRRDPDPSGDEKKLRAVIVDRKGGLGLADGQPRARLQGPHIGRAALRLRATLHSNTVVVRLRLADD